MKRRYTCSTCGNTVEIAPAKVAPGVIAWPVLHCVGIAARNSEESDTRHLENEMGVTPVLESVGT